MKPAPVIHSMVPGACVAAVGAVFLWWYGQGVVEHLTAARNDLLWRGAVSFLSNLLWVGLGMVAAQLIPQPKARKVGAGVALIAAAVATFAACGAFRMWAELDQALGGVYLALTMGRPSALLFLLDGTLLGYGIKLARRSG